MNTRFALVFGGSRGIGAAIVRTLARDGLDIVFTYNTNANAAQSLAAEVSQAAPGTRTLCVSADVRAPAAVDEAFAFAQREFGSRPHCVIVNAGISVLPAPVGQFDPASFGALVETNIIGAFNVLREAAQRVEDGGAIIALTTSMVRHAVGGLGPYTASKAAVEGLLRSMAKELGSRGIRVNGVAPGPIDTELFHVGKTEEAKRRSAALSPFDRIGTADEVAEVVAFLVSPRASWVHGQIIQPNGGMI